MDRPLEQNFEHFLMSQAKRLTQCEPKKFEQTFIVLANEALEWFKLDRLTLFPNSMILLNDGKTISVSGKKIPDLNKHRFIQGNYKDYLKLLRSKKQWQSFSTDELKNHHIAPLNVLYEEGVMWHGIIKLELFGQTWGALALARFNPSLPDLTEDEINRIKLLCDIWLCYWQHSTVTRNLRQDINLNEDEGEKLLLLTKKQCSVLTLLAQGYTAKQCAEKLFLSSRTIESHKYRMLDLLNFDNHTELVQFALRNGLGIES